MLSKHSCIKNIHSGDEYSLKSLYPHTLWLCNEYYQDWLFSRSASSCLKIQPVAERMPLWSTSNDSFFVASAKQEE